MAEQLARKELGDIWQALTPEQRQKLDPDKLDMQNAALCVYGLIFGNAYGKSACQFKLQITSSGYAPQSTSGLHGTNLEYFGYYHQDLVVSWIRELSIEAS